MEEEVTGRGGQRGGTASTATSAARGSAHQHRARAGQPPAHTFGSGTDLWRNECENEELLGLVNHSISRDGERCALEQDGRVIAEVLETPKGSATVLKRGGQERTPSVSTTTLPVDSILPLDGCARTPSSTAVLSSTTRCERSYNRRSSSVLAPGSSFLSSLSSLSPCEGQSWSQLLTAPSSQGRKVVPR